MVLLYTMLTRFLRLPNTPKSFYSKNFLKSTVVSSSLIWLPNSVYMKLKIFSSVMMRTTSVGKSISPNARQYPLNPVPLKHAPDTISKPSHTVELVA